MMKMMVFLGLLCLPVWSGGDRIVSLAPGLTETVCLLGRCDALVGVTNYCTYPEQVKALKKVGGYVNPNLEIIVTMRPDLILSLPEQRDAAQKLIGLGMNVAVVQNYSITDIQQSILDIGARIDREAEAKRVVTSLKAWKPRTPPAGKQAPKVLVTLGHEVRGDTIKEIYIVGRKGYLNELLELAGGTNIYDSDTPHFPKLSHEMLLRYDPDVIIDLVPKAALTTAEAEAHRKPWQAITQLRAVRQNNYHIVAQEFVLQAGPRYMETLERFAQILAGWAEAPKQ